ncbi:hypothetical protein [Pandoraea anhela]|uniref:hypothetical protein n=1 Tax=Pandoraea anhela TaxID=2508295 RepID=UPI001242A14B|nr:hypothetical protein [Pandoraea anhela]
MSLLISFWGLNYSRQLRIEKAERIGEALKVMGDKVQGFVVEHHDKIEAVLASPSKTFDVGDVTFGAATDVHGNPYVTNLSAGTLIKATGASGIGEHPPGNVGDYRIHVYRSCNADKSICNVETLTYIDKAILKRYSADADMDAAAIAARKIGALGGISSLDGNHDFRFMDSSGNLGAVANPSQKEGLVAVRGGYATSALDVYVRRDGSRSMTGALNMEHVDDKGKRTRHDIVGAGDIKASNVIASERVETGALKAKEISGTNLTVTNSLRAGAATLSGTLDMGKNDIVGAHNIVGGGELTMSQIDISGTANVGALKAAKGATLGGALDMQHQNIDKVQNMTASAVSADDVSSGSGVIELKQGAVQGQKCDIWGLTRDAEGRLLSCQREKPGINSWIWKLASTPGSVKEVPVEIIKEIEKLVKVDEQWKVSRFSLVPTPEGARHGNALYFYVSSQRDAKVLACTITNANIHMTGAMLRAGVDQGDYIVTQSPSGKEELICLSKGTGVPRVRENAWYWWGWPGFEEHGGYRRENAKRGMRDDWYEHDTNNNTLPQIHRAVRSPTRVVADTQPTFNNELKVLFSTFGIVSSRRNMNGSVHMGMLSGRKVSNGMSWSLAYGIKNTVSCKFKFESEAKRRVGGRAFIGYEPDSVYWYIPWGDVSYTVQCAFTVADLAKANGFTPCIRDCPLD